MCIDKYKFSNIIKDDLLFQSNLLLISSPMDYKKSWVLTGFYLNDDFLAIMSVSLESSGAR